MQHSTLSVHILWLSAVVLGIRSTASRSPVVWALHLGLRYGSLWGVSKLRCWIIEHIPVRPVIPCILYTCNPAMTSIIQVFYSILWTGIPTVLACKRCRHGRLGHRHCLHLWQWIETYFLIFLETCQTCHLSSSGFQANHGRYFTNDMLLKATSNLLFWWLRWMPEWMSVYHCKVTPFFFNWGLEENKDAACEFYLQNGFVLILKEAVLCKLKSWSILIWWFMLIQTLRGWAWITDFARSPTPYKT